MVEARRLEEEEKDEARNSSADLERVDGERDGEVVSEEGGRWVVDGGWE